MRFAREGKFTPPSPFFAVAVSTIGYVEGQSFLEDTLAKNFGVTVEKAVAAR